MGTVPAEQVPPWACCDQSSAGQEPGEPPHPLQSSASRFWVGLKNLSALTRDQTLACCLYALGHWATSEERIPGFSTASIRAIDVEQ